jgi:carbamoyltransferase
MTTVLGISAFYHDSSATLLRDGEIVAAVQEERFSREKYDPRFPARAVEYCLREGGIDASQLDLVAYYEQPLTKLDRLLETYIAYAPQGFSSFRQALPVWVRQKLHVPREIRRGLGGRFKGRIVYPAHHESHAASAFFPSPFPEAAILTVDGVGEWSTTTYGLGRGNRIELQRQLTFPHSLGLLYSAFTYYCGFKVNSGEYKLMGLAPYGEPRYVEPIMRELIDVKPDGSYRLDLSYFNYAAGLTMTGPKFHALFGGPPRVSEGRIEQRHMDLAASIQKVTEDVMLRSARHVWAETGHPKNLVLAGGVALNCVANGRILREGPFENIWIQPAAGDAGGSLGAAYFAWHQLLDRPREVTPRDKQKASYLGPRYTEAEVREFLDAVGASYTAYADDDALFRDVAESLDKGRIVGWFTGRAEYGPRALGARSIVADPRNTGVQSELNVKIKFRESFRPFAPCVLREHGHEWFDMRPGEDSPYMLLVAPVRDKHRRSLSTEEQSRLQSDPDLSRRVNVPRSDVPAITHVDYSARIQTVDDRHGRFQRLMKAFYDRTGCPIVVNTSFNLSWEPIVLTPAEAYHTFMQSEMDELVLETCVLRKERQPLGLDTSASASSSNGKGDSPWADPASGEPLYISGEEIKTPSGRACYPVTEGIPRLFALEHDTGEDVTEVVQRFYEKTPFPNYDDVDSRRALVEKARAGIFARLLGEQIPYDARVLEVGCGTGQLTNFLSIAHRSVLGIDACLNSLRLAQQFKTAQGIERATFAQMNLFRPALKDSFFDVVISNGVLHHTSDARRAFARVSRLVKPGGYFVVGLYSKYSRQVHYARRGIFRLTGISPALMDPHFAKIRGEGKREAWLRDQYLHPHETSHTLDEVLGWVEENDLEFVNSIPKPELVPALLPSERLFDSRSTGTGMSRFLSQLADVKSGYREGGFFIVICRRPNGVTT